MILQGNGMQAVPVFPAGLYSLDGARFILGDEQVGDDVVGDEIPLGGQGPAAVAALDRPGVGFVPAQDFFQGVKGQHEQLLVFLRGDAGVNFSIYAGFAFYSICLVFVCILFLSRKGD